MSKSRAMRIVSLLPSATEILFAVGAGEDVVGVTHECDFPEAARALPALTASALPAAGSSAEIDRHVRASVHGGSSLYHLDADRLATLAPDLIVTQELCAVCAVSYEIVDRAAKRLRGDPRIVSLEPSSLDDVFANIALLGDLTGRSANAERLLSELRERVESLRARTAAAQRSRVLVLEWTDPPMSGGHWTPGLVELAGGAPVLGNPSANSVTLAWETIAAEDPDAIVVAPCGYDLEKTHEALEALEAIPAFTALRAYREDRVFAMDGNAYLNRPGPRLVETAEIMAELLASANAER